MDDLIDSSLDVPKGRCSICGYTGPALVRGSEPTICYECRRAASGSATVEWHHIFGKANDKETTAGMLGNIHREMERARNQWPEEVRKNSLRDPLLWIIGVLFSTRDFFGVMGGYVQRAGDWLLLLHGWLVVQLGAVWWPVV